MVAVGERCFERKKEEEGGREKGSVSNERRKGIGNGVLNLNKNVRKKEKGGRRGEEGLGILNERKTKRRG